jgi:hypothetical protein
MLHKISSPKPGHVRVVFELPASLWADRVSVVGDFNGWDPTATPLRQDRHGIWQAELDLPVGRRYAFHYLIDGRWCTDYHADGSATCDAGIPNSVVDTFVPVESCASFATKSTVREERRPPIPFYVKRLHAPDRKAVEAGRVPPARPSRPSSVGSDESKQTAAEPSPSAVRQHHFRVSVCAARQPNLWRGMNRRAPYAHHQKSYSH